MIVHIASSRFLRNDLPWQRGFLVGRAYGLQSIQWLQTALLGVAAFPVLLATSLAKADFITDRIIQNVI